MSFETPEARREEAPKPRNARMLAWLGATIAMTGALERPTEASADVKEAPRYAGKMLRVEKDPDLDADRSKRVVLDDGKIVQYYEGSYALPKDPKVIEHRVVDVHVLDQGDKNRKGDERWIECTINLKKWEPLKVGDRTLSGIQSEDVLCHTSAGEAEASGLHMESPIGAYDTFGQDDPEWEKLGAFPRTADDLEKQDLNTMYWAVVGLDALGLKDHEATIYMRDQVRERVNQIRAHDPNGTPLNDKIVDKILPKQQP